MPWWSVQPRLTVSQLRAKAIIEIQRLKDEGRAVTPVTIEGKKIAQTFWGNAWCDNIEAYRDFEYRLPRGRSYVRNRAVVDLQLSPGRIEALVCGSELYQVKMQIDPLPADRWDKVRRQCVGEIGSLIELLQGRLSDRVMQIITDRETGLFPTPAELSMRCQCFDGAMLCKHAAAVLYGVGARMDSQPELLFTLRQVDHLELITQAESMPAAGSTSTHQTIATHDVASIFGIDVADADEGVSGETTTEQTPANASASPKRSARAKGKAKGARAVAGGTKRAAKKSKTKAAKKSSSRPKAKTTTKKKQKRKSSKSNGSAKASKASKLPKPSRRESVSRAKK